MDVSIVAEKVSVYERADEDFPVIGELAHGARVGMGKYTYRRKWLEIFLPGNRRGFVFGNTPVRAEPMQHHVVIDHPWTLRGERKADALVLATVSVGQVVACGSITTIPTGTWIEVLLKDGTIGYVDADSKAQRIAWSTLAQSDAMLRESPAPDAALVKKLKERDILGIGPMVEAGYRHWTRVLLPDGSDGYVPADTKVLRLDVIHAETRLPTLNGKCIRCSRDGRAKLSAIHLGTLGEDDIRGIGLAAVCDRCVSTVRARAVLFVTLVALAMVAGAIFSGYYFLGVLGFVPLFLYFLNAWQVRGKAQRYRYMAEDMSAPRLRQFNVEPVEVEDDDVTDISANWVRMDKYVFCPGCGQLHVAQAPWCPHCKYLLHYRVYPRS